MKKILLLILLLAFYSQTILCQDESNNVTNKSILLEIEKESESDELKRKMMNESVPDLLKTSIVNENYPKGEIYLTGEKSIKGTLDLEELNNQLKKEDQNDFFFEILTFLIASVILFLIGRVVLKQ